MQTNDAGRLARAVLGYLALMIAIITLAPFRFESAPVQGLSAVWDLSDIVLNVVLFVPLGFVHQLARPRAAPPDWLRALGIGALLSGLIEGAQSFTPLRYPSLSDLIANASGAALGTLMAARATRSLEGAETVRAFALDLPLVGLTYLFVPLLWLVGLSADRQLALLLVLPVMSVAWILASVHAAYVAPKAPGRAGPLLALAAGAFAFVLVGLLPAARHGSAVLVWGGVALVATALLRLSLPTSWTQGRAADGTPSRRFEAPTLRVALMPLALFTAVAALWPLDAPVGPLAEWRGMFAIIPPEARLSDRTIFRAMAHVSAFTIIGYALAEHAGREVGELRAIAPRVLAWALALSLPLEFARGLRAGTPASALMLIFTVGAALLGAWFYLLQLRNVQALLGRRPPDGRSLQPPR
jgi:VanZ family protein